MAWVVFFTYVYIFIGEKTAHKTRGILERVARTRSSQARGSAQPQVAAQSQRVETGICARVPAPQTGTASERGVRVPCEQAA